MRLSDTFPCMGAWRLAFCSPTRCTAFWIHSIGCMQDKGPEDHSATGSASELHGGAQQAGWQGPKDGSAPSQNGIRDEAQLRPAASEKGQSPASSRQISSSFSLQSSLSEPVPGQLSSGQDGPAVPNASGRGRGSLAASSEVELQRDSASQVELAARAVEAREMEKERLRCAIICYAPISQTSSA